jgi:hypothetical protein
LLASRRSGAEVDGRRPRRAAVRIAVRISAGAERSCGSNRKADSDE